MAVTFKSNQVVPNDSDNSEKKVNHEALATQETWDPFLTSEKREAQAFFQTDEFKKEFEKLQSSNLIQNHGLNHLKWEECYHIALFLRDLPKEEDELLRIINTFITAKDEKIKRKTFAELEELCRKQPRNDYALYCLALCYRFGFGIKSNIDFHKSTRHCLFNKKENATYHVLDRADAHGNPLAAGDLGDWLCQTARFAARPNFMKTSSEVTPDMERGEGIKHIINSAEEGNNSYAQFLLGFYSLHGYGIQRMDNEDLMTNQLMKCYIKPEGDTKRAITCFKKSADKGDPYGQVMLGYCFENGIELEKDPHQAFLYYSLAEVQGAPFAKFRLAYLCESLGFTKLSIKLYEESSQKNFRLMLPEEFIRAPHECDTELAKRKAKDPLTPLIFSCFNNASRPVTGIIRGYVADDYKLSFRNF